MGEIREKVMELASPMIEERGLELVDVEFMKEGSEYFLRIYIYHPDGIGHNHCSIISEELNTLLDLYDLIPESYILEVSSPGLERPLKRPHDYLRYLGERVLIKTYAPIHNEKEWQGKLLDCKDGLVHLGLDQEEMEIPIKQIASARLMVEF